MKISGQMLAIIIMVLLMSLTMLAACGDDNGTEEPTPTQEPQPTEEPQPSGPMQVGSTWVYDVTYGEREEVLTVKITGEEMVDGVDSFVAEFTTDPAVRDRISDGTAIQYVGEKKWFTKDAWAVKKRQLEVLAMGGALELMTTIVNTRTGGDPTAPLSVGDTWAHDAFRSIDPPVRSDQTDKFVVKVAAMEEISVPAGTFNCYKLEYYKVVIGEELMRAEWITVDGSIPGTIKFEDYEAYDELEVWELVSYSQ